MWNIEKCIVGTVKLVVSVPQGILSSQKEEKRAFITLEGLEPATLIEV